MDKWWLGVAIAAAGCGSSSKSPPDADLNTECAKNGGQACFQLPTAPMTVQIVSGDVITTAPPTLGCTSGLAQRSTLSVTVKGNAIDYQNINTKVAGAQIALYSQPDVSTATPVATAVSAADGSYTLQIPAGTYDFFYRTTRAPGYADLYNANYHIALTSPNAGDTDAIATPDFIDSAYGLVRLTRDPQGVLIVAQALDCNLRTIEHAVGVISSASGQRTFVAGAGTYYGADVQFPIPVLPEIRGDTNKNGSIGFMNVPATTGDYVQLWGFPDDAAQAQGEAGLMLVAEYPLTLSPGELLAFAVYANH